MMIIIDMATAEIPPDVLNLIYWILFILILVLILIIIFIALILLWFKRQEKYHYPIKSKVIMHKERALQKKSTREEIKTSELDIDDKEKMGEKPTKHPKAKPVEGGVKPSKIAAVTPIRISSHIALAHESRSEDKGKIKSDSEKTDIKSKLMAKPVHHSSRTDSED